MLVAPLSSGTITISSAKMKGPPIIDSNWLIHPTDQAVAVTGYKRARAFFESSAMKPVLIGGECFPEASASVTSDEDILAFIGKSFGAVFHASYTCKMGNRSNASAALDARARVRVVKNLRVVDASSFPFLPPGHPVATVCEC